MNDCSDSVLLMSNSLSDSVSESYVVLIDLPGSGAVLVVNGPVLLSVSFVILCSGGPG